MFKLSARFSSVQSLSHVQLFLTPRTAAHQASLSITNSQRSLKLTSIKSVMPSSHLIRCCPLLLLPPIPPSIRVFSNESTLHEVAKVLEFHVVSCKYKQQLVLPSGHSQPKDRSNVNTQSFVVISKEEVSGTERKWEREH